MTRKGVLPRLPPEPPSLARRLALWLLVVPFAIHLLMSFMFGMEADTSGELLIAVMLASASTGAALAKKGFGPVEAAAAGAWPPALFAWRHWYWAMDMHSPGGAAQWMVGGFGWAGASATLATAAVAGACALPGWALMRVDAWHERRTGRSFFDDD